MSDVEYEFPISDLAWLARAKDKFIGVLLQGYHSGAMFPFSSRFS
jgi:hypothetical protein